MEFGYRNICVDIIKAKASLSSSMQIIYASCITACGKCHVGPGDIIQTVLVFGSLPAFGYTLNGSLAMTHISVHKNAGRNTWTYGRLSPDEL